MGLYDAQKNPFHQRIGQWQAARANDHQQRQTKGIPCHVVKIDKDFVEVQFDTQGSGLTPPTVKMPQSFSQYGREPTQVGDKGYAVPSDYHLGAADGWGQGTNYYPRGNLSPLSFQPTSHTDNPKRDYDQHTIVGGPNGVRIVQSNPPKQQGQDSTQQQSTGNGGGGGGGIVPVRMQRVRLSRAVPGVGFYAMVPAPRDVSTGAGGASRGSGVAPGAPEGSTLPPVPDPKTDLTQADKASLMIDQNAKHTLEGTEDHRLTIDHANKKATFEVPDDNQHFIWLGGPGKKKELYAKVATAGGPAINIMAKIKPGKED